MPIPQKTLIMPKGQIIQCWACKVDVLKLAKDLYKDDRLDAKLFIPLIEEDPMEFMVCPKCYCPLFMYKKFFFKGFGWLPKA